MQLPATPPAGTPPPDADGFYTLPEIPTEMTHGSIYLPYRLTPYQQAWNIFGFFQTLTAFLLSLFFLYIARRVPLTSAKVLVLCIIYLDLLSIGDTCIRHATAWGFGYFPGGFYTCQVQGFINGIWGAGAQSAALAFTFERYLLIVSWQEVKMRHVKLGVIFLIFVALFSGSLPFMMLRPAGVMPSGIWCTPAWSTGTWHGAVIASVGVFFIGIVLVGQVWMYLKIYAKFRASQKDIAAMVVSNLETKETLSGNQLGGPSVKGNGDEEDGGEVNWLKEQGPHPPVPPPRTVSHSAKFPPSPLTGESTHHFMENTSISQSLDRLTTSKSHIHNTSKPRSLTNLFRSTPSTAHRNQKSSTESRLAYSLALQAFIIVAVYYVCMLPLFIVIGYNLVTWMPAPAWADYFCYVAACLYPLLNPVIFMSLNKQYRGALVEEMRDWKEWLSRLRRR